MLIMRKGEGKIGTGNAFNAHRQNRMLIALILVGGLSIVVCFFVVFEKRTTTQNLSRYEKIKIKAGIDITLSNVPKEGTKLKMRPRIH